MTAQAYIRFNRMQRRREIRDIMIALAIKSVFLLCITGIIAIISFLVKFEFFINR